ncbi:MAG TPA: helix-turn-helix domain-containing protein, partial [Candidatus Nanoarchaeia archaeon]|nr:helix-turn-helix domain-containing protein [Candidatus Nanoarchaeia archaeon]
MIDLLRKLGLNKYESDAYVALVKLGSASAFNISKASSVPFGRIYDSLNVLEIKGLVEVVPTKPKKYKAVDPTSALNTLVDEGFNELTKIRADIKNSVASLVKNEGSKDLVSVNSGRVNFSKRVTEHFNYKGEFFATSESFGLEKSFPALNRYIAGEPSSRYVLVDKSKSDVNRLK